MSGANFNLLENPAVFYGKGWLFGQRSRTGHSQSKANVSDTDLARNAQGGAITIGSTRGRTKEGRTLSSLGTSGLRIP